MIHCVNGMAPSRFNPKHAAKWSNCVTTCTVCSQPYWFMNTSDHFKGHPGVDMPDISAKVSVLKSGLLQKNIRKHNPVAYMLPDAEWLPGNSGKRKREPKAAERKRRKVKKEPD